MPSPPRPTAFPARHHPKTKTDARQPLRRPPNPPRRRHAERCLLLSWTDAAVGQAVQPVRASRVFRQYDDLIESNRFQTDRLNSLSYELAVHRAQAVRHEIRRDRPQRGR
jgi:hypothetical protein